jgi:uncharacterized protein (DUF2141 family)
MKHRLLYIPILLLFLLSFVDCAKKGTPSGGKRDSIPPVIIKSSPENYSINFTGDEIRIQFDEYIRLKDLQKELLVSPPLKYTPVITPLSASKILKIKILDTLKENTTYSFNFGNSIVDNNEGNSFKYFKYVFSTGTYIDSLKLVGKINDALLISPEIPTAVLLYEINDTFNDSLVFSEKPTYIETTKDSTSTFEFSNLKEGNYLLLALKEENNNYTFQPINDKIGFAKSIVSLPTDSSYVLTLFKEVPEYKIDRPKHRSKHSISFGYQGDITDLTIDLVSEVPEDFESRIIMDRKTDSLFFWFKPEIKADSIVFVAKNKSKIDSLYLRIRDLYKDSLEIAPLNAGFLIPNDTLKIKSNTPLVSFDAEKIRILNVDSVLVKADLSLNQKYNVANIIFPRTEDNVYKVRLLPGALIDYFEKSNDTLDFRVMTKGVSDYGTLSLTLENSNEFPILVQLVNEKFIVVSEFHLTENAPVFFDHISPGNFYLRIVYDENGNKKWDTGNFLNRLSPEKIIYYPSKIEVRANWSLNETFILE